MTEPHIITAMIAFAVVCFALAGLEMALIRAERRRAARARPLEHVSGDDGGNDRSFHSGSNV